MTCTRRLRLLVSGRVQGVWFRGSTEEEASRLGVDGFVRNLTDGRVEVLVQGSSERVERLVAWCRRGPRGARVDGVEVTEETPSREEDGFRVRW